MTETSPERPERGEVFVVHGRSSSITRDMCALLRCVGVEPQTWEEARKTTRTGSPSSKEILATIRDRPVIALLTGDDNAHLRRHCLRPGENWRVRSQPRPNVFFEIGLKEASRSEDLILVRIGNADLRDFSDLAPERVIQFDGSHESRDKLLTALETIGVPVNRNTEWANTGEFLPEEFQPLEDIPFWRGVAAPSLTALIVPLMLLVGLLFWNEGSVSGAESEPSTSQQASSNDTLSLERPGEETLVADGKDQAQILVRVPQGTEPGQLVLLSNIPSDDIVLGSEPNEQGDLLATLSATVPGKRKLHAVHVSQSGGAPSLAGFQHSKGDLELEFESVYAAWRPMMAILHLGLVALVLFLTSDPPLRSPGAPESPLINRVRSQFLCGWRAIWISWGVLYAWLLWVWAGNPPGPDWWPWACANILNTVSCVAFYYCFLVLDKPSIPTKANPGRSQDFHRSLRVFTYCAIACALLSVLGPALGSMTEDRSALVRLVMSGGPISVSLLSAVAMAYFFGRLDSRYMLVRRRMLWPLYMYVGLQMSWAAFPEENSLLYVLHFGVVLLLKVYMAFVIYKWLDGPLMVYFATVLDRPDTLEQRRLSTAP